MSGLLKHVGQVVNTGKRCVVAFLQIPELEDHALIIDTDSLPDRYHQPLMDVVVSSEGQNALQLADVLGRRIMPDTGRTILETLHFQGYLTRMPIENIVLMPRPNQSYPLKEVLIAMGRNITPTRKQTVPTELTEALSQQNPVQPEVANVAASDVVSDVERGFFNQNRKVDDFESKLQIAKNMLSQAEFIEEDARQLRNRAYQLVPELNPVKTIAVQAPQPQTAEATHEHQEGKVSTSNRGRKRKAA